MGFSANPLTLGCDCLGEIHYFDGTVNDSSGNAVTIPNAICMHEEDYGISWKHTDFRTEEVEVRRSRRLVISMICTVGNYEYGFFWYFYNDASIEVEVKLSGVLTTGAVEDGEVPRWGKLVAPGIYGPNHQHFFNFRLDMSVDGPGNSVYEVDSIPEPDPALNPHHNAWITQDTLVASEAEGARDWDWSTGRYWKITNPSKSNELGAPVAYKLTPQGRRAGDGAGGFVHLRPGPVRAAQPVGDQVRRGARSSRRATTCTSPPTRRACREFIADDAPLENTDVVLWYTLGAHHVVRPGGLAGDAVRVHGIPPQAGRLLRRQPGTGHPAVTAEGLPPPLVPLAVTRLRQTVSRRAGQRFRAVAQRLLDRRTRSGDRDEPVDTVLQQHLGVGRDPTCEDHDACAGLRRQLRDPERRFAHHGLGVDAAFSGEYPIGAAECLLEADSLGDLLHAGFALRTKEFHQREAKASPRHLRPGDRAAPGPASRR